MEKESMRKLGKLLPTLHKGAVSFSATVLLFRRKGGSDWD